MSEESRADRIRERRKASSEQASAPEGDSDITDEPSELDKLSKSAATTESAAGDSVKDQQTGTYMYLPDSQKRELDRLYSLLKAEYEYEYEQPFEKNRHFYPVVIQAGLDQLEDLDVDEVNEHLERMG